MPKAEQTEGLLLSAFDRGKQAAADAIAAHVQVGRGSIEDQCYAHAVSLALTAPDPHPDAVSEGQGEALIQRLQDLAAFMPSDADSRMLREAADALSTSTQQQAGLRDIRGLSSAAARKKTQLEAIEAGMIGMCLSCGQRLTLCGRPFTADIACTKCLRINVYVDSQQPVSLRE